MPLINHQGERISYECEDLIKELEDDIAEFGGDMIVDVVTMRAKGVTLYIDYNFVEEGKPPKILYVKRDMTFAISLIFYSMNTTGASPSNNLLSIFCPLSAQKHRTFSKRLCFLTIVYRLFNE